MRGNVESADHSSGKMEKRHIHCGPKMGYRLLTPLISFVELKNALPQAPKTHFRGERDLNDTIDSNSAEMLLEVIGISFEK